MNTAVHLMTETTVDRGIFGTPIVIVGTGPVGIKALTTLLENNPDENVVIYGDEPWEPYNRVKLSSFLAGEINWSDLTDSQRIPERSNLVQHQNCRIVKVDRENNTVIDEAGNRQKYKKLILALGSQPHIPGIEGTDLREVYTFRNLTDAQHLLARQVRSRRIVVVGGGVLGLEAAKAMSRNNTEVTVIDHAPHLMISQLDEMAAELLREHILSLGIKIYLGSGIKRLLGEEQVSAVELINGKRIDCDTVIFSTGIRPNIDLARAAKVAVGRGIRVSDTMQTSDPDIYAIGECAEHREIVYGLVAPGFEQAKVAVADINGRKTSYTGSIASTQLKVVGLPVFSMGRLAEGESKRIFVEYVFNKPQSGIYRKVIIFKNRLVGSVSVGKWESLHRVQEGITKSRYIWPWQLGRFIKTGDLWPEEVSKHVSDWPAGAVICNCMNVTRGQCSRAIHSGCASIEEIMQKTSASTVCGSCRPLLTELLGGVAKAEKIRFIKSILVYSLLAGVAAALAFLLPGLHYNQSAQDPILWDFVWRENLAKQISGYSILALTLIGLLVSLRKRWKRFSIFDFPFWRYAHVFIGLFIVFALFAHTGFRLGDNLNAWLMSLFTGLILIGGIYGMFISVQHRVDGVIARQFRCYLNWTHLLLFWPIPVLLTFHVLKSYYF